MLKPKYIHRRIRQKTPKTVNFENCKAIVPITTAVQFMSLKIAESHNYLIPRIIRIRDAPFYLGMDKNRFNAEVRPTLTELKIGTQGVAFDRLELDAWVDDLISRTGNKTSTNKQEKISCQKRHQDSPKGTTSGMSTKSSKDDAFVKALAQATSKKPKASLRTCIGIYTNRNAFIPAGMLEPKTALANPVPWTVF
jgi:hypothetical protein